jgi:ketosteroid isomerase-like protein
MWAKAKQEEGGVGCPMAQEENKALLRRVIEAHSKGNLKVVDKVYASDYVLHTPTPPTDEKIRGPGGIKLLIRTQLAVAPGLQFIVEDQIAEGDKVVTRYTSTGGVLRNGRGIIVSRIRNGKIAEEWIVAEGSEFQ